MYEPYQNINCMEYTSRWSAGTNMYQVPIIVAVLFNASATKTKMQDVDNHGKKTDNVPSFRWSSRLCDIVRPA